MKNVKAHRGSERIEKKRRKSLGYTAVEVMISMSILAIGAGAVVSMQRGAVQGNVDARHIDTANAITRRWVERLRRDAMLWTLPNSANTAGDNRASKALLLGTVDGEWRVPIERVDDVPPVTPGFDLLGRDLPRSQLNDQNALAFCTNVRLTWLIPNQLIRAEVRVFWPRGTGIPMGFDCASAQNATLSTNTDQKYRFVYASTAIRRNAQ